MPTQKLLPQARACRVFSRRDRDVVGQVAVDDASLQVGAPEAAKSMSLDLDAPVSLGMIAGLARKRPDLAELRTQLAIMALAWSWPAGRGPASAIAQHERSKSQKQTLFARESIAQRRRSSSGVQVGCGHAWRWRGDPVGRRYRVRDRCLGTVSGAEYGSGFPTDDLASSEPQ